MALFPGTPKLESRNCPGWSPGTLGAHNSRLQSRIATRSEPKLYPLLRSFQRGVALSNRMSRRGRFLTFNGRESNCQFDFGPSFAHNLGCRCPNGQCEAIFDIYASRPFQ
jgi:hypothetical protein